MRVAVLSLTRDRLGYTEHCFQTLRDNADCDYDHFVLDQGSTDGTPEWLLSQDDLDVTTLSENVGISRGLNMLLDEALNAADYDVIVKVDNDCELLTPGTLEACARAVLDCGVLASPTIHGLRNPPRTYSSTTVNGVTLSRTISIGGIFLAAPAYLFADGYRHNEANPLWGGDDVDLCAHFGFCCYLEGFDANHYLGTDGQLADIPAYFERRVLEGGPAR